jgi:hypothetical protein
MNSKEFTAQAYEPISNVGGLEIMLNRSNDGVFYRFNYGQDIENEEIFEAEIEYGQEDDEDNNSEEIRAFFRHGETKYFLDRFMKTNYGGQ